MRNIEFKAELREEAIAREVLRQLGATRVGVFEQTDTYYRVARGRLKKREARLVDPSEGEPKVEVVFYERPDRVDLAGSDFTVMSEAEAETRYGQSLLPVWLVVRKIRELWMAGSVRVHLDEVEDLGRFVEFEAPVNGTQPEREANAVCAQLRRDFGPALGEAIADSYSDLMERTLENDPGA